MDGFVTLAVGDGYLQRAAAFALSARRFGFPTVLMYRDLDPGPYQALFLQTVDLARKPTANPPGVLCWRELKKYAWDSSESLQRCAFVDADSLVIRDPTDMFEDLSRVDVHTPCARDLRDEEYWAAGCGVTAREAARAMGVRDDQPLPTLNGGFLFWKRGDRARRWFADYVSLYERLAVHFAGPRRYPVQDELCAGIAFALHDVPRFKSDSSIGVWDAGHLSLDIERQQFECTKQYYWEGHRFRPYIAHFGGSRVGRLYRESVEFLCRGTTWRFPVFGVNQPPSQYSIRANGYSLTDVEMETLRTFVRGQGVRSVLEFGPGRSTECFLAEGCHVWSLEYQPRWLDHYRRQLGDNPKLTIGRFENSAHVRLDDLGERRFDLAFVDAPTGQDRPEGVPHSRLNTLTAAAAKADLVLLHDAQRPGERAAIETLCASGWQWRTLPNAPKIAVLRRTGRSAADGDRRYDFGHWPALPKVSCQCVTYGRTALLDEAVESFLRQDYVGEKELVILNDLPSLHLQFEHPEVRVINLPYRMRTVGEKRNACVALCTGDVIFPWDDDDISLPHRISFCLARMTNRRYFKADRLWYWSSGEVSEQPRKTVAHAMSCWSLELFDEVGGYPPLQSGQDMAIEERFKGPHRCVQAISPSDLYYIYRFPGTGSYHLSAHGYGKGYDEAARHVQQSQLAGDYRISPVWRQDYLQLVADAVSRGAARQAASAH